MERKRRLILEIRLLVVCLTSLTDLLISSVHSFNLLQIPGAMEHGITSDDIFWLKKSPGKTWGSPTPTYTHARARTHARTRPYIKLYQKSVNTNAVLSDCFSPKVNISALNWYIKLCIGLLTVFSIQWATRKTEPVTSAVLMRRSNSLRYLAHWHVLLSCTVIFHQWHAVCFSPFLSGCLRLMIQISTVHPDLYRTSPLIQPFSPCHRLVNWSFPDVSSWHDAQKVTRGCGVPRLWLLFASRWQMCGNNDSDM